MVQQVNSALYGYSMEFLLNLISSFFWALYFFPVFLFEMTTYQFGTILEGNVIGGLLGGIFIGLIFIGTLGCYGLFIWFIFAVIRDKVYPREKRQEKKKEKEALKDLSRHRATLDRISEEIKPALVRQNSLLSNESEYLMKKDWESELSRSSHLCRELESLPAEALEAHPSSTLLKQFLSNHRDQDIWSRRNGEYKQRELKSCAVLFEDVEGHPLDAQQMDAIVTDEYNNLVIAGAGSGKTVTVLGKVKYLVYRKGIRPEEILVTSFTNKSVGDLRDRLANAGIGDVHCRTFHSFGLNQLNGLGVANENEMEMVAKDYLHEGIIEHPDQTQAYLEFYGCYKHLPKDYSEYDNAGERFSELKASDLVTLRGKLDTLKGERVKSTEELMIANFLYLHGIAYDYERNYSGEYDTEGRAYQPDFYLPDYDIWLEHFGINENGRLPWMENAIKEQEYIDGMAWKRAIHEANGTRLIESYSFWNKDHDLLNKLEALLRDNGVEVSEDPERLTKIYEELSSDDGYLSSIVRLVTTFLSLAKANKISMAEVWERGRRQYAGNGYMWHRFELFMTFAEPIMNEYESKLRDANQIDFDDMINLGTDSILSHGMDERYKYIIVDEYQDISRSRFELIKAIREFSGAKLMCVGDDWQSIYRFAGSDISLFTHFEDYVGYAERLKIEQTYRNSQELVDIASEFIEKNPSQVHKEMKSRALSLDRPVVINQVDDASASFEDALSTILSSKQNYSGNILVLGRHNRDIEKIYLGLVGNERISFWREKGTGDLRLRFCGYDNIRYLTVHRAKGLEADDVIVLNLVNALYGFPNRLEDDPILQILLGAEEGFDFAEERRLFYVALTRTRNSVILISCGSTGTKEPSPFVNELKQGENAEHITVRAPSGAPSEWDPTLCPTCGSGRLVIRSNQETGEQFLGCTNYPYCDETYNQIEILQDRVRCPACGDWMVRRNRSDDGKPFFGCSNYPKCRASFDADDDFRPIERQAVQRHHAFEKHGHSEQRCPECGGSLVVRRNKKDGSQFYGCSNFPRCRYTRNL